MKAYKIFTHDLRSPIQGGEPVWDGTLPYRLPEVEVDRSSDECGAGWNACRELHVALRIAGLWPGGRPSRAFVVDTDEPVVKRGDKCRATTWEITRECTEDEIRAAVGTMSEAFGDHAKRMTESQMAWREALGRPLHDKGKLEAGLKQALETRGLARKLKRLDPLLLTTGLRDAYKLGLAVAIPTGPNEIGWAMVEKGKE